MKTNHNINDLKELLNQVWKYRKYMPNEYKRTMTLGCSSIGFSLASLAMNGTAKKVTAAIGLTTYVVSIISALDANKKFMTYLDATPEEINRNLEEYEASHPEIFGNN